MRGSKWAAVPVAVLLAAVREPPRPAVAALSVAVCCAVGAPALIRYRLFGHRLAHRGMRQRAVAGLKRK
ncbi:MAG: hypothetical protein K6T75_01720 [Acetobacteraceae bacterium]|nr:hypothetical protein [Acetobacteraceae bacterium]